MLLLLTSLIWGLSFVAQSVSSESIGPFTFNSIRFLIGAIVLIPFALPAIRRECKASGYWKKTLKGGIICGICGVDENGKVQGVFAPTGQLPTFFDEFEAKGQPVDKDVFLKNAVPLDATGEPDKQAVARLQQELAGKNVPPAPPAGPVQQ